MATTIETKAPQELSAASLQPRGPVCPSPEDWRDQTLYFLLPDRFSDGDEAARPLYSAADAGRFAADRRAWMSAGTDFVGGTLRGIRTKLAYLQGLGVTTLWIGPVWKQCRRLPTYHGYGVQDFLEVDPRFGSRQDLRDLVDDAHQRGMYVLLDVIYNHAGDVFFYDDSGNASSTRPYRFSPPYPVHGWRSATGESIHVPHSMDDAVWPRELQRAAGFTRAGQIGQWDPQPWEDPLHPDNEFRRGDFFSFKNFELDGSGLAALIDVYRYWIAVTDCDGFRIDTVKHVPFDTSRHFCGGIREFAESIGKQNFLLLGEVTGGAGMARNYLDIFGRNLDAALDIGEPAARLANFAKGFEPPRAFFDLFGGHDQLGSHREAGRYHVSVLDDHDMVGRDKARFAAHNAHPERFTQVAHAVGVQLTTLGMPCIYYGTEQAFDGSAGDHDPHLEPVTNGGIPFEDRYIREAMFGAQFGAFRTTGCHFFDEEHPTYVRIAAIARLRNAQNAIGLALRRGRSYLRDVSVADGGFAEPGPGELAAWSRIQFRTEVVVCLNTDPDHERTARITIDAGLHRDVSQLQYLYRSDWSVDELNGPPPAQVAEVQNAAGRAVASVTLPPAGMAILSATAG